MKKIILDNLSQVPITKENANSINISYGTFKTKPSWYIYQNDFYYFKERNLKEIKNHLLAAKIAHFFDLKSPDFLIAIKDDKWGLLSKNFRLPLIQYDNFNYEITEFFEDNPLMVIDVLKNFFKREVDFQIFIKSLFRLLALQITINLEDMTADNILIKKEKGKMILDYIYDFDFSFEKLTNKKANCYESALISFLVPSEQFYELCTVYPYFKKQLQRILNIDIIKYIDLIEGEYDIYFDRDYYLEQNKEVKNLIRSLKL